MFPILGATIAQAKKQHKTILFKFIKNKQIQKIWEIQMLLY